MAEKKDQTDESTEIGRLFSLSGARKEWSYKGRSGSWTTFEGADFARLDAGLKKGSTVTVRAKNRYNNMVEVTVNTSEMSFNSNDHYLGSGKVRYVTVLNSAQQAIADQESFADQFIEANRTTIESFFAIYADDDDPNIISVDGLCSLCEALGIDVEADPAVLVISYYCRAGTVGEWQQDNFIRGMARIGCTDVASLQSSLDTLRGSIDMSDKDKFMRMFWKYLFFYFKGTADTLKKVLAADTAIAVMELILASRWELWPRFKAYLEEIKQRACRGYDHKKQYLNADEWYQVIRFAQAYPSSLDGFEDDDEFWPTLIDNFAYEFMGIQ